MLASSCCQVSGRGELALLGQQLLPLVRWLLLLLLLMLLVRGGHVVRDGVTVDHSQSHLLWGHDCSCLCV